MEDKPANLENETNVGGQYASMLHQDWDDDKVTDVKLQVNNLIWMHAPDALTLREADERACEILNILQREPSRLEVLRISRETLERAERERTASPARGSESR